MTRGRWGWRQMAVAFVLVCLAELLMWLVAGEVSWLAAGILGFGIGWTVSWAWPRSEEEG